MALEAHMQGLNSRHQKLEQQLSDALSHPSIDPLEIAKLKREKLRLKDELQKLQSTNGR